MRIFPGKLFQIDGDFLKKTGAQKKWKIHTEKKIIFFKTNNFKLKI